MTSAMDRAVAGAQAALRRSHGQLVTYGRGESTVEIQALEGRSEVQAVNEGGVVLNVEARDWLIAAADLVLDDAAVEPLGGDTITVSRPDEKRHVYEVMPVGTEACFRPSDGDGVTLRIHTKEVGTQEPEEPEEPE